MRSRLHLSWIFFASTFLGWFIPCGLSASVQVDGIYYELNTSARTAAVAGTEIEAEAETVSAEEPSVPQRAAFSPSQIAQGVEYLATHNQWNRDEMEKIPALQGLWDAVNTYQLDLIRSFNDQLASTPLTAILEGLERTPKTGYYAAKADHVITLSTYIKRLR